MTALSEIQTRDTVLVVDDTPENLAVMSRLLKDVCRVKVAPGGARALAIAGSEDPPDLVLLDVMMPEMDGHEVCRRLKANPATADLPVIFLTAMSDDEDEKAGFDLGAVDYITKPFSTAVVLARVRTHLALKHARDFLRDKNAYLEHEVQRRTQEARVIQDVAMVAMGSLAEARDNETGNHIRRTQMYVRLLVEALRDHPRFRVSLGDVASNELLVKSAPLHDIGKVGIPDTILLKPGKLTPEEFEVMKTHVTIGRDAIWSAEKLLDSDTSFMRLAREIAYYHHEKWDGTGYPQRLAGEAIPVSARLMALADVYDALISRRVYKAPFSRERAVGIIREGRGSHFDPDVVDAFLSRVDDFSEVATRFADSEESVLERGAPRTIG